MDLLARRKPFIFVQELPRLESTKDLLTSKLQFLVKQIKFIHDSVNAKNFLNDDFSKNLLFWTDLQVKIAYTLIYLTNSSSLEWAFLKTLKNDDEKCYFAGSLKPKGFILDTESIFRRSGDFFLALVKLGCIDFDTWINLQKLKSCSEVMGLTYINDSTYYSCKNIEIFRPVKDLARLHSFEEQFWEFVKRPINFRPSNPVVWNLYRATNRLNNHGDVCECLHKCEFKYEKVRIEDQVKKKLDPNQYRYLVNSLSKLNCFVNFYKCVFEFQLMESGESVGELFKYLLNFFFLQEGDLFDLNNIKYEKYTFGERVVRAILWLDFLSFMCRNAISLSVLTKGQRTIWNKNFASSCAIELSIFSRPELLNYISLLEFSALSMMADRVKEIRASDFYRKNYAATVDKYLRPLI